MKQLVGRQAGAGKQGGTQSKLSISSPNRSINHKQSATKPSVQPTTCLRVSQLTSVQWQFKPALLSLPFCLYQDILKRILPPSSPPHLPPTASAQPRLPDSSLDNSEDECADSQLACSCNPQQSGHDLTQPCKSNRVERIQYILGLFFQRLRRCAH
jgi:hypothetical protein